MRMPTPARVWLSASLICAGFALFPAYHHWLATRTWEPVDIPVSLAPGHINTGDFEVNLHRTFHFAIETAYSYDPACQDYNVLQTRWWLSRDGQAVETWEDFWNNHWARVPHGPMSGSYLGAFEGDPGRYSLDVEIASDASCLQKYQPKLRVYADDSNYAKGGWIFEMTLLTSCLLIGVGAGFLGVSCALPAAIEVPSRESLAIFKTLRVRREASRRKLMVMGPASILPTVGYFYAATFFLLFLTMVPFRLGRSRWDQGIPARLLRANLIQASLDQPQTGLLVEVDGNGDLYLSSKPVTAAELQRALEDEFARRADWSVYVEADPDVAYAGVVRAMDTVRGAHGKVILLTPDTRADVEKARASIAAPASVNSGLRNR
jgi:biopolymer transport protein ExbD